MAVLDVLVAIDAQTIADKVASKEIPAGTADAPTVVQGKHFPNPVVYMVTKQGDFVSGNAGTELNLKAETEDVVRWRETTLSLNAEVDAILYEFVDATNAGLITAPIPIVAEVKTPLPDRQNPTKPKTQTIQDYFWEATVLSKGNETYHFRFMLVDRHMKTIGYFSWDPFITITD